MPCINGIQMRRCLSKFLRIDLSNIAMRRSELPSCVLLHCVKATVQFNIAVELMRRRVGSLAE